MSQTDPAMRWAQACTAAALVAIDPRLGGASLRAAPGPVRDVWLAYLRALAPGRSFVRLPASIDEERLDGGLDLPATLALRRPVRTAGLLAQATGGFVCLAMAERTAATTMARLSASLDLGADICIIALDEAHEDEDGPPPALMDRLAFHIDLTALTHRDALPTADLADTIVDARARLASVTQDDACGAVLVATAARLGIASLRAPLLALRAARAACALRNARKVGDDDLALAAALVLAPRATRMPESGAPDAPAEDEPEDQQPPPPDDASETARDAGQRLEQEDLVLEAAKAAIPPDLLDAVAGGAVARTVRQRGGMSEVKGSAARQGRPLPARRGDLRQGRLALVETLRAAAPWQALRGRHGHGDKRRVIVQRDDFRIARYARRVESVAIFVVDASGSAALQRLAEVKGAIELILADCYVRRDSVAMIAFRGRDASLVLPPTRSLVRARRCLAALPGGGGTPLAAGLDAACQLGEALRRKGRAPLVVLLTDGRANIARDGAAGRPPRLRRCHRCSPGHSRRRAAFPGNRHGPARGARRFFTRPAYWRGDGRPLPAPAQCRAS